MLNLNVSPTSNGLAVQVSLLNNGAIQATLAAGAANVLTVGFNQLMLVNPGLPPVVRNQVTPGNFASNPGDIAIIENAAGGGVNVSYAPPGGHAQVVHFA